MKSRVRRRCPAFSQSRRETRLCGHRSSLHIRIVASDGGRAERGALRLRVRSAGTLGACRRSTQCEGRKRLSLTTLRQLFSYGIVTLVRVRRIERCIARVRRGACSHSSATQIPTAWGSRRTPVGFRMRFYYAAWLSDGLCRWSGACVVPSHSAPTPTRS